jgi:DNA-binding GntR family transcriptional regulator
MPKKRYSSPESEVSSLAQTVYESLKEQIVSFELTPGTLLTENGVAEGFGVSRTPVREALQLLSTEGLVEITPSRGARVVEYSLEEVLEAYTIRGLLEPHACGLAAERITAEQLSQLGELSMGFPGDVRTHQQAMTFEGVNRRFHIAILETARSPMLTDIVKRMMWTTQQTAFYVSSKRYNVSNSEHRLIVEHLRSGDSERASRAMRRHLARAKQRLIR